MVTAMARTRNAPSFNAKDGGGRLFLRNYWYVAAWADDASFVDGVWRVVDATCLAPRQTMVRIATGRDAADTAFLDNHKGAINLNKLEVTAIVDGDLPMDSIDELVSIG